MKDQKPAVLNYLAPVIMITLGLWHFVRHGVDWLGAVPVLLGSFTLYMALFNHVLLQRVLTGLAKLWYPVGQFITGLLLVATFYLVFAPVGFLFRLLQKDILNKRFRSDPVSYWIDRPENPEKNYTQQF